MRRRLVLLVLALGAAVPASALAAPTIVEYDLGEAHLVGDVPTLPPVPLRLQGVIAVPEVAGRAPVAVLLHGTRLRAVEIRGDRTASGAILIANVEFAALTAP